MELNVTGPKIIFQIPIFGGLDVTETIINSWIVIAIVFIICLILTHKLEKIPKRRTQQLAEKIVIMIDNLVCGTMGKRNSKFAPYILTLFTFAIFGSLISLLGLRSITADINVTVTWSLMTFILIYASGIRAKGLRHFKTWIEPFPFMLPLNLISEIATPLSMSLRLFCNITAGMIITSLIYGGLTALSTIVFGAFNITFPVFAVGIPAFLSIYFDVFTGAIQSFVFCMLTMVFVSNANEI